MARTVMVPSARHDDQVYVERGAGQAVLYAPGMYVAQGVVLLRLDHALAFARPCRRCWP